MVRVMVMVMAMVRSCTTEGRVSTRRRIMEGRTAVEVKALAYSFGVNGQPRQKVARQIEDQVLNAPHLFALVGGVGTSLAPAVVAAAPVARSTGCAVVRTALDGSIGLLISASPRACRVAIAVVRPSSAAARAPP